MTAYTFWLFLHVLLLVFWLGTDLGVFLAAKFSERAELSVETRATVLKLGMILDRLPRSALVLILPSGMMLLNSLGLIALPTAAIAAVWAVAGVWLVILWTGFLNPETPLEAKSMLFNFAMNAILAIGVTALGIYAFVSTALPSWVALKILVVGLVFVAGVALDVLFKPAVGHFVAIVTEGPTEARNRDYSTALAPVYWAVIAIYVLVLIATFAGLSKLSF
ncbi:MAG: hypothetical protein AAGC71_14585 [Pseudomonadota bacterium]